ncbi:hypothetical protein BJ742DRAFT_895936 [Cladochytrium replicatum]|nr:hypothetical protein BJ742DRAFT_895936 [Cladochytrium replicatum]
MPARAVHIDRVALADLTPELFAQIYRNKRPLLITHALDRNWLTPQTLRDDLPEIVEVMRAHDCHTFLDDSRSVRKETVGADSLMQSVWSDTGVDEELVYYRGLPTESMRDRFAAVMNGVEERCGVKTEPKRYGLWVGTRGNVTPMHYDSCHVFLAQIVGRKRWVIFSHEDTRSIYPYDGFNMPYHAAKPQYLNLLYEARYPSITRTEIESAIRVTDPWQGGFGQFCKLANCDPMLCELGPGEVIYNPSGFW